MVYSNVNSKYIMTMMKFCRCGQGLNDLYNSPQIQMFLNCYSANEQLSSKKIYQPGCLRKVKLYFAFTLPTYAINIISKYKAYIINTSPVHAIL